MTTFTSDDRENSYPKLIKYRDAGMNSYTYFWTINNRVVPPYFDHEDQAKEWKYEDSTRDGNWSNLSNGRETRNLWDRDRSTNQKSHWTRDSNRQSTSNDKRTAMTQEVHLHKDDLNAILEFANKYPDSDYITVSCDSSSGIGILVSASLRAIINEDPVIITKQIVDESSW